MNTIDPAAIELPPTQPIDMTALLERALAQDPADTTIPVV